MHALKLAVNLQGWRIFVRRREDKAFLPIAERVYKRDNYICQYCDFQAKKFQEIINIDGDYTNHKLQNLITACCFCSQCLFLESIGLDEMSGGQIIYLPEMSQANLNSFCHVLFCALSNGTGYQETATAIYRHFKFRSQIVENKLGAGTSNPSTLGQLLIEYQAKHPKTQVNILNNLRLLPSYTKFKLQLDTWAADALEELEEKEPEEEDFQ